MPIVLHCMQEWTLKQALDFVTAARPQVSPNAGFMARLIRLEESLHGTKTVKVQPALYVKSMCKACGPIGHRSKLCCSP